MDDFQNRVSVWTTTCFGEEIATDPVERNHRFLEEALELVQACGCSKEEALQLVDYTFGREAGEKTQEVGGVLVTLAALCNVHDVNMDFSGRKELKRCWSRIEEIREKQARKPKNGPLPQ